MRKLLSAVLGVVFGLAGCAHTVFYDSNKEELPGLPFLYHDGQSTKLIYVNTSTGFGTASFAVERDTIGGYTQFSTNLDSTAAAQIAGNVIDKAFEAGKKAMAAEVKSAVLEEQQRATRSGAQLDPQAVLRSVEAATK